MGRTCRIILDGIERFTHTGYYVFGVGAVALLFHFFAWDLAGLLLFAVATCFALLFVKGYRGWVTLFANIIFVVSTQNSPAYGDGAGNGGGANYYMRPDILYPLIVAVALVVVCMIYRTIRERKNLKNGKLYLPLGILSVALLLAGAGGKHYFESVKATSLMVFCLLGLYVVFTACIDDDGELFDYISVLFSELAFLIAIEVAYVYFLNILHDGSFDSNWKNCIITGWGVSNVSGELIACFLPFAFRQAERSKHVVFYELIALFAATMIVFTLSRTGILVGGVVAIVFVIKTIIHRKKDKRALVLTFIGYMSFLLVAFIALIGFTDFNEIFDYFEKAFNGIGQGIDSGRFRIWKLRFEYFVKYPVFGAGYATEFCEKTVHGGLVYAGFAHNMIIDAIGSNGVVGVLALGTFAYFAVKTFIKKSEARFFAVAFGLAFAAVGMLDITYCIPYCLWFFTLVLVVVEKVGAKKSESIAG